MTLTEQQKAFLVMAWGRYTPAPEIRRAFAEHFGVEIDHRLVCSYNPEGSKAHKLRKWLGVFEEARQSFIKDVEGIPIAHRGYRLRKLQGMFEKALGETTGKPNIPLAASLLEQAAKESGGSFTNESKVTGKVTVKDERPPLDDGEKRAVMVGAIEEALAKMQPSTNTRH